MRSPSTNLRSMMTFINALAYLISLGSSSHCWRRSLTDVFFRTVAALYWLVSSPQYKPFSFPWLFFQHWKEISQSINLDLYLSKTPILFFYYDTESFIFGGWFHYFRLTVSNLIFLPVVGGSNILHPQLISSADFQSYVFNHEQCTLGRHLLMILTADRSVMSYRLPRSGVYPTILQIICSTQIWGAPTSSPELISSNFCIPVQHI